MAALRELLLGHARVTLVHGDPIDNLRAALYAMANARGVLASGFSGAIRLAGGGEIERELRAQMPLLVGNAYQTGSGALASRGVERVIFGITAAEPGGAPRRDHAEDALVSALEFVNRERIRAMTFPEVATRVPGITLAEAATILVDALSAHIRRGSTLDDVVIAGSHLEYLRACRDGFRAMGAVDP